MKKKMKEDSGRRGGERITPGTHRNLCFLNSPLQHQAAAAARAATPAQGIMTFTELIKFFIPFLPVLEGTRPYIEGNGVPSPSLPCCIRSNNVIYHATHRGG